MQKKKSPSWTYALLTPDALVTDSIRWLKGKLYSAGLVPVSGALVRLESTTMLSIYDVPGRSRPVALPPKRAFDLWYGIGPGYLLLLRHERIDACAALLDLKGATDPSAAPPDTIRYAGENALTNLLHCPDDSPSALDELSKLLGKERTSRIVRFTETPDDRIRELTVDALPDALPAHCGGTALSVQFIVNRIRLRIAQHLAIISAPSDDAFLSVLAHARAALDDERRELVQASTSAARFRTARAHDGLLHGLLHGAARDAAKPALAEALINLSAFTADSADDWTATEKALKADSVYISTMESTALELSTYV